MSSENRKAFGQALMITLLSCLISELIIMLFPHLFIKILFGSQFKDSAETLIYLSLESIFIGLILIFVLLAVARNSLVALSPWMGILLVVFSVELLHKTAITISVVMLVSSMATFGLISFLSQNKLLNQSNRSNHEAL